MTTSEEIKAEYTSSLADLTCNSKPLINVLTMLAEENIPHAKDIVEAIEKHLSTVQTEVKLPILYLIDCIVKNVGRTYTALFSQNIVLTFCSVFKVVDEKTRSEMFKLRQTWNDVFPQKKLYAIDVQISVLDPAWPVTAAPPANSIHFNPKFLKNSNSTKNKTETPQLEPTPETVNTETLKMQEQLLQKQKELLELQQKKLELEVLQTKVKLQEQIKNTNQSTGTRPQNILLKPHVAKQLAPSASFKSKPTGIATAAGPNQRQNVPRINPVNSALISARPPIRDPRLLRQQQKNNSNVQAGTKTSVETNKSSLRHFGSDPRLANNKDESQNQKTDSTKSKTRQTDSHKSPKTSRVSSKNSTDCDSKSSSSKSGSSTSLDSPSKSKSDKSSPKSPSRHKKKHDEKKTSKDSKRDKSHKQPSSPTSFKGLKGSMKNRNYIRRNLSPMSPDPSQDEDLRSFGLSEKRSDDAGSNQAGADVDLRQLPATIGKKRSSTETLESSISKKAKTKTFDVLFGNEDTDLRQIPGVTSERPPTPPPPIISSNDHKSESPETVNKPSNLDAIRVKLANATNRDKIFARSFNKRKMNNTNEDKDLRVPLVSSTTDLSEKIIISPADEQCINAGNMTKEQSDYLLNKIILQMEKHKLREAQKKDNEETTGNVSLQTISDEDLSEEEEKRRTTVNNDKDERVHPSHIFPSDEGYGKFPPHMRRMGGGPTWRGRRRAWDPPQHLPVPPHMRPTGRPWNQQKSWRPMGLNYGPQQPHFKPIPMEEDVSRSPETYSELVVDSVNKDDIKTLSIDNVPRDIRYYDEIAVIFMNWDDPREISFQDGVRRVIFNDSDSYVLSFNENYSDVHVNGVPCKVRLGAPSREIYINEKPYECFFGGPGITIDLNGVNTTLKLEGPAPQVKIGTVKRTDLVAGKVNLIVNAKTIVPVFLDAKLQKFVVDGETVTLKFVDALKTVLINDVPFTIEFGGLPKPITIHDKKHFIRFSVLPKGIKPGHVKIKNMEGSRFGSSPKYGDDSPNRDCGFDINEPALPILGPKRKVQSAEASPERNSNSPHSFQSILHQQNFNNLDLLSNVMTAATSNPTSSSGGYQVENINQTPESTVAEVRPAANLATLPSGLNINELFQKLVATGIVTSGVKERLKPVKNVETHQLNSSQPPKSTSKRYSLEHLKPVSFNKPETLKIRQSSLYSVLYSGMQCSSCGMRFPPEQSMHYSQHLDWHFRQNRKGKKNIRVASSRRWYYNLSDWKNYEEIEDLEEREKNFFDQQLSQAEGSGSGSEEDVEIPSVASLPNVTDDKCDVCRDKFDQFFNEDKEEWHLRNAVRVDGKAYHPICYEDFLNSQHDQSFDESITTGPEEESKQEEITTIPGLEIILDDDDDVDVVEPVEQESDEVLIEESEESKPPETEDEKMEDEEEDDDDDDVILNEVAPIKIVVDDDDDYSDTYEHTQETTTPLVVKKEKTEIDDGFVDVGEGFITFQNGGQIKIKSEPIDTDEIQDLESVAPETPDLDKSFEEHTHNRLISTIDGNFELDGDSACKSTVPQGLGAKIKINISKPLPVIAPKETKEPAPSESDPVIESVIDPSQPLPPGEEPVQLNLKPSLKGIELKKLPKVRRGTELTGLCSIM